MCMAQLRRSIFFKHRDGPLKEMEDAHEVLASLGLELSAVLAVGFGTASRRGVLKASPSCCYFDSFLWERTACKHLCLDVKAQLVFEIIGADSVSSIPEACD